MCTIKRNDLDINLIDIYLLSMKKSLAKNIFRYIILIYYIDCNKYDPFKKSLQIHSSQNSHLILSKLVRGCLRYF